MGDGGDSSGKQREWVGALKRGEEGEASKGRGWELTATSRGGGKKRG